MAFNFKFPDVGEGIHEGKIVKLRVKEGDLVKADQVIVEVETDKAIVEIPSPETGSVLKLYFKEGDVIKVGQVLITIGKAGEAIPVEAKPQANAPAPVSKPAPTPTSSTPSFQSTSPTPAGGVVLATPAVRQLARELGVDLTKVVGTGPGKRITPEDVHKAKAGGSSTPTATQATTAALLPPAEVKEGEERKPLSGVRKAIAEVMTHSKQTIPHCAIMEEADVTALWDLRAKEKKNAEKQGVKLTFLAYITKAVANALTKHAKFNASLDYARKEVVYKKHVNVGIAADTEEGLLVPVIHDADKKTLYETAQSITDLAEKARGRKLKLEEMRNATFTITNFGSIGGEYSMPVINPPEVAILGVGKIKDKPGVLDNKIVARKKMGLSLSFDHRLIDGADAARLRDQHGDPVMSGPYQTSRQAVVAALQPL